MDTKRLRLGIAAAIAALAVGTASPALAQRHHHGGNNAAGAAAIGLLGGLALGAAIGNAQPPPPPPTVYYAPAPAYAGPNPHVDWCYRNTPGYNPYDNTYQG